MRNNFGPGPSDRELGRPAPPAPPAPPSPDQPGALDPLRIESAPAGLIASLNEELRALAAGLLRRERPGHTLQPTAIVSELWLRLAGRTDLRFASKEQFLAYAAASARHILVDYARKRKAASRGGDWTRCDLEAVEAPDHPVESDRHGTRGTVSLVELDDELGVMAQSHPRSVRVFELRYFGGMTCEQIAPVLGVSSRTVQDDWQAARLWLQQRLDGRPRP